MFCYEIAIPVSRQIYFHFANTTTLPYRNRSNSAGCYVHFTDYFSDSASRAWRSSNYNPASVTAQELNGLFTRNGLKINVEKTEVLHIGYQREELDIELEGKKLTQGDSFVYLGGAVCGDGKTEREVRRRVQAGANAWRAAEGVMADRRISKRLKGKVMSTCVTPACLYGTETLALTELQQQRLQVCESNWIRKIARVTRADRRRMVELREETGV